MQEKILELLPEIDDIEDNGLRERVLASWVAAARRGGWQPEDLPRIPSRLDSTGPVDSLFNHVRAVAHISLAICGALEDFFGQRVQIDRHKVLCAALLHDLGKLLEYNRDRQGKISRSSTSQLFLHPISGAILAGGLGIPEDILHVIVSHSPDVNIPMANIEGVIVQHANAINRDIANLR